MMQMQTSKNTWPATCYSDALTGANEICRRYGTNVQNFGRRHTLEFRTLNTEYLPKTGLQEREQNFDLGPPFTPRRPFWGVLRHHGGHICFPWAQLGPGKSAICQSGNRVFLFFLSLPVCRSKKKWFIGPHFPPWRLIKKLSTAWH